MISSFVIFAIVGGVALIGVLLLSIGMKSGRMKNFGSPKKVQKCRWADGVITTIQHIDSDSVAGTTIIYHKNRYKKTEKITVPKGALIINPELMLKQKSYCLCCHTYDSKGNHVEHIYDDEVGRLTQAIAERDRMIEERDERIDKLNNDVRWISESGPKKWEEIKEMLQVLMPSGRRIHYNESEEEQTEVNRIGGE